MTYQLMMGQPCMDCRLPIDREVNGYPGQTQCQECYELPWEVEWLEPGEEYNSHQSFKSLEEALAWFLQVQSYALWCTIGQDDTYA
jgi:hypothetical protein